MRLLLIKLREPVGPNMRQTFTPPIGLWAIREAARDHGWECVVVDRNIGDPLPLEEKFDVVGISAQFSQQHDVYVSTTSEVAVAWPNARIIAGGFHAAATPALPGIDAVCRGPGEPFLFPGEEATCPKPERWELERYWVLGAPHDLISRTDRWITIETSRGCGRHCGFCGVHDYWGSPSAIAGIPEYLVYLRSIGVEELFIEDDNMLLRGVPRGLSEFAWSCPNGVEIRSALRHLDELAGCWRLSLPFETGSQRTATLMQLGSKWLMHDEAVEAVERISGSGIRTCGFFIIGYPGETLDDMRQTLDYANSLPLDDRHIYIATPYPGTELYRTCKRRGYLRHDGVDLYRRLQYTVGLIDTPEWSAEDVQEIREADRAAAIARRA